MTVNARMTGAAVEAHFQFLMWLVPAVEKFPRKQKFLLCDVEQALAEGYASACRPGSPGC